jgi:hypothetical protein
MNLSEVVGRLLLDDVLATMTRARSPTRLAFRGSPVRRLRRKRAHKCKEEYTHTNILRMSTSVNEPKYRPPKPNSTFGEDVASFGISDLSVWAGVTAASFPIGYAIGRPIRGPAMWVAGGLGFTAGFMLAYQRAAGRNGGWRR